MMVAVPLRAQTSVGDISGSYAILGEGSGKPTLRGGSVSASFNLNDKCSIAGDLGIYEGSGDFFPGGINVVFPPGVPDFTRAHIRTVTFGVGPRVSYHNRSPFTPYGELLFGLEHIDTRLAVLPLSASTNRFAIQFGGGIDAQLATHWALRLVELTFPLSFGHDTAVLHLEGRVSGGIVYRF
jgi:hypothetical protein